MIADIETPGHLRIARRAGGAPIELIRSSEELVFLAFDASIKRLVELHILRSSGQTLDSVAKKSAFERAELAVGMSGHSFLRILEVGEHRGLVYYTSNLTDGEFMEEYVARRGPLHPATVFSLVFQLLDELLQHKNHLRVVQSIRLGRVVLTTVEDTFLQLRFYDYGFSVPERAEDAGARQVREVCELMHLMLTGQPTSGAGQPDRHPVLSALPMRLRTTMRSVLTEVAGGPFSLERLREDVREAIGALVSNINSRHPRKQLGLIAALQPHSHLQALLMENAPVEDILGNRFEISDEVDVRRRPFSIPCFNSKNGHPVTVHLLPPARIVDKAEYEVVSSQMWRFSAEKHPHILRSLSLWESPDWTFLAEEREPGFTLSRLLAERGTLNPPEVALLMRQVHAGQEQASECGVHRLELHPSNILLRVGRNGPLASREHDRLMQKRLDAWPPFKVKVRAHLTMRNLYEPPLVDQTAGEEPLEEHFADQDYRSRAFVVLTVYLLTGQRPLSAQPCRFPDAMPPVLADFLSESLEKCRFAGRAPLPADFLVQFESLMSATSPGAAGGLAARLRGAVVAAEEMESVGSISDFEDEWVRAENEESIAHALSPRGGTTPVLPKGMPRLTPSPICSWKLGAVGAAAALAILGLSAWCFMGSQPKPVQNAASAPVDRSLPVVPVSTPEQTALASVLETEQAPLQNKPIQATSQIVIPETLEKKPLSEPRNQPPISSPLSGFRVVKGQAPLLLPSRSLLPVADLPSFKVMPAIPRRHQASTPPSAEKKDDLPPQKKAEPETVIRRALLPSPEELARFRANQELRSEVISTAQTAATQAVNPATSDP